MVFAAIYTRRKFLSLKDLCHNELKKSTNLSGWSIIWNWAENVGSTCHLSEINISSKFHNYLDSGLVDMEKTEIPLLKPLTSIYDLDLKVVYLKWGFSWHLNDINIWTADQEIRYLIRNFTYWIKITIKETLDIKNNTIGRSTSRGQPRSGWKPVWNIQQKV